MHVLLTFLKHKYYLVYLTSHTEVLWNHGYFLKYTCLVVNIKHDSFYIITFPYHLRKYAQILLLLIAIIIIACLLVLSASYALTCLIITVTLIVVYCGLFYIEGNS